MSEGYQGWTNHETWVVNLWIGNDEVTYRVMQNLDLDTAEKAKKFYDNIVHVQTRRAILKDIGNGSIDNVNWQELSEAWSEG